MQASLRLRAPADFRLRATVLSHGWSDLAPFGADRRGTALTVRMPGVRATVRGGRGGLPVVLESETDLPAARRREALRTLGSCLRFDLDLAPFWRLCREDGELGWASRVRAGRFLRAPTAFADAAMMLATTNCSWALTRRIVAALVEHWGEGGAFPSQEALAAVPEADLRRHASLGYRAPYLAALARGPGLEDLRNDGRPTEEVRCRLLGLPGFGPYAADNLLRLLGRFEHLALDSWVRARWKELHPRDRSLEAAIGRRFRRFGEWKGLALWLHVTEPWYAG